MDYDLTRALDVAWGKVKEKITREPGGMEARLARRRMGMMRKPPRAWCLAVRACDTRITPWKFAMAPDKPEWWDVEAHRWRRVEHEVTLEAKQLRWLCRPVTIPRPGVTQKEAAEMLGVDQRVVHAAVRRGQLWGQRIKGLGGARVWVQTVYTTKLLDLAGMATEQMNDAAWGTMWRYMSDRIPAELRQTLVRRPVWRGERQRYGGWRWICPGCGKETRVVYCPMPGLEMARFVDAGKEGEVDAVEQPAMCFACSRCHGVHDYGRLNSQGWNELVMHLSGGLLYGKEVERPGWWETGKRRKPFRARPGYPVSKRRVQITAFLVDTELSCSQIARRLGLRPGTGQGWVWRIYQKNGVHARAELRKVLRQPGEGQDGACCQQRMAG